MEALISAAVIILLCVCFGMSAELMLSIFMIVVAVAACFIFLFFVVCAVSLIGSKKIKVKFSRFEKNDENGFERAIYSDDNNEHPNVFPSEKMFKHFLYNKEKDYFVRLCRKKNKVYDKYSIITVVTGLLLGGASSVGLILYLLGLVR